MATLSGGCEANLGSENFRNSPVDGVGVGGKRRRSRFKTSLLDGAVNQRDNADDEFSDADAHGVVNGGNTAVGVVDDVTDLAVANNIS